MLNITQAVGERRVQPPLEIGAKYCLLYLPREAGEKVVKGQWQLYRSAVCCSSLPPGAVVYWLQFIGGPVKRERRKAAFTPEWNQDVHRLDLSGSEILLIIITRLRPGTSKWLLIFYPKAEVLKNLLESSKKRERGFPLQVSKWSWKLKLQRKWISHMLRELTKSSIKTRIHTRSTNGSAYKRLAHKYA